MIEDIFLAFWFFLPAGAANVAPIFAAKIPILKPFNAPIDGGRSFRGMRLLGANKTWRGLVAGVLAATFTLWLQQVTVSGGGWLGSATAQISYDSLPVLIVGPLFAIGALGGDAIESFFKRRRGIAPGSAWFPFDQTDYIIGGAIAVAPFVVLDFFQYIWLIAIWIVAHLAASYIGWLLGLKDKPI